MLEYYDENENNLNPVYGEDIASTRLVKQCLETVVTRTREKRDPTTGPGHPDLISDQGVE